MEYFCRFKDPSMKTVHLVMVRHGETVWNTQKRHQGQLDSPLTSIGQAQGQALATRLRGFPFQAVYSSDLGRTMETAQFIAQKTGSPVQPEPRLRERHYGLFQGLTIEKARENHPAEFEKHHNRDPDFAIPGGESPRQFYERTTQALDDLVSRHDEGMILAVTHGGVLINQIKHVLGIPLHSPRRFSLLNTSVNIFSYCEGCWMLETWGDAQHLLDLNAQDEL
jgi:probable phosphoglycerate mutase